MFDDKPAKVCLFEQMSRSAAGRHRSSRSGLTKSKICRSAGPACSNCSGFWSRSPPVNLGKCPRVAGSAAGPAQIRRSASRSEDWRRSKWEPVQAVADLQQAVRADAKDNATPWAHWGEPYSSAATGPCRPAQLSKSYRENGSESPNRDKWDSLLQTNRYWLLIKRGDNALKAGELDQAQNYYAQAQRVDTKR